MLDRKIFREYRRLACEVGKYYSIKIGPSAELEIEYQQALIALREHLDKNGMRMPLPKYPYDREDKNSHRFINNPKGKGSVLNPNYMYKDKWEDIA